MSNSSDVPGDVSRLLGAIAQECRGLAEEIAGLGGRVSGDARAGNTIVALQSFDYLAQLADAQAALIARLASGMIRADEMTAAITAIPLPHVRARLLSALTGAPQSAQAGDDEFWWDA